MKKLYVVGNPVEHSKSPEIHNHWLKNILNKFKENKHIFNLSHGVLPQTPVENVEILVEIIRNYNET